MVNLLCGKVRNVMLFLILGQESSDAVELSARLIANGRCVGQVVFMPHPFELMQQRDDSDHATGGAGAGATMRQAFDFRCVAGAGGGSELLDLIGGLLQIQGDQLTQILGAPVRKIQQAFHVHRRLRVRDGWEWWR